MIKVLQSRGMIDSLRFQLLRMVAFRLLEQIKRKQIKDSQNLRENKWAKFQNKILTNLWPLKPLSLMTKLKENSL